MEGDEGLGPKIDLPLELIPWPRPVAPFSHKRPILLLRVMHPHAKLAQHPVYREPARHGRFPDNGPITTPAPESRVRHHFGSNGIEGHIPPEFREMPILFHENGGESPLEEMPPR